MMLNYSVSQLMKFNNFTTPSCISVIKQLKLLRRPRYIHRSSRRKLVYSNSGNAIPSIWSAVRTVAPQSRHRNAAAAPTSNAGVPVATLLTERDGKRGVDFSVLHPIRRPSTLSNFKSELFNTHYLQKARSSGRGGGLATIYRSDLDLSYLPLPELSSCECLAFRCKLPSPVTILLIYRPPKPNPSFIPEMYNLLSPLCTTSANIIIIGDINIHVNNPSCRFAAEFLQMLDCFSLRQLVDVPTHSRGHTLDLVITDSAPVRNLSVYDLGVSDHRVVSMELPILSLSMKPKCQICFRNLKKINPEIMTIDLKNLLHTDLPSVNDAVDLYNKTLSSILDLHAPVKTRTVTFSRSAPWFTDELREMKAAGRALERCYKASGLTVHKLAYREHQKAYSRSIMEARSQFYGNIIKNSQGNSKQLFKTINHLLKLSTIS
ncbi:hypothetical protein MHYP_G00200410 [Metynnis hypsauchen]